MAPNKKTPKIKQEPQKASKQVKVSQSPDNLYKIPICWRVGNFDANGEWGVKAVIGGLSFSVSEEILQAIADYNNDSLLDIIDELSKQTHPSHSSLFDKLQQRHNGDISTDIIKQICCSITYESILKDLHNKMKEFENLSWSEIDRQTYGKDNKSKHHSITIDDLSLEAQRRLETIGFGDLDEIYSNTLNL